MTAPAGRRIRERVLGGLAIGCIVLQFPGDLGLSVLALAAWLVATACLDRSVLRRMWMPRFWAVTVVLALATGVVLGRADVDLGGLPLSTEGLLAGVLMVVRGALIFGLATWAGPALAGHRLQRVLGAIGLARLGGATSVALGVLPELRDRLSAAWKAQRMGGAGTKGAAGRLHDLAVSAFCETVCLAGELAATGTRPVRVAVLVGEPGGGKTTRILGIATRLREAGLRVGGIAQPAVEAGGRRIGYDLVDLAAGQRRAFARLAEHPPADGPRFEFEDAGWAWAADRIREARRVADVVVVDEIGRVEAAGGGHLRALLEPVPGERARWWLLSVRADGAAAVEQWAGGFDVRMDLAPDRDVRTADEDAWVARMVETVSEESREGGA